MSMSASEGSPRRRLTAAERRTPGARVPSPSATAVAAAVGSCSCPLTAPDFVVVGNPGSRRVDLFQAALARLGLPPARLVTYADLLAGRGALAHALRPGAIVRIESPGKDFEVQRALLALGADADEPDGVDFERLSRREVAALSFERGRILPSRQWYLGYCVLLQQIAQHLGCLAPLAQEPAHATRLAPASVSSCEHSDSTAHSGAERVSPYRLMNPPADIATMFDKRRCHARLCAAGLPVPPALEPVRSYDELIAAMQRSGRRRVFIKPAHGSSASGVVALQIGPARQEAITTVELVRQGAGWHLYNSRRIRTYRESSAIAALLDAVCRQRVHVEQWLPKAGHGERAFDLRVVVIAGQARHVVVRLSRSPMTNLHLLNARGDAAAVLARIGAASWEAARRTCERAARHFPSLYTGIDLLITPDYRQHAILELNAFGDLLPGVLDDGQDTYTAEIIAALAEERP